jgi:hypothetical protein
MTPIDTAAGPKGPEGDHGPQRRQRGRGDPNGRTAYVLSGQSNYPGTECGGTPTRASTVTPINTAITPSRVGNYPVAIAITPDGKTADITRDRSTRHGRRCAVGSPIQGCPQFRAGALRA